MKAKPSFSLKDQLFNADKIDYLAGLIVDVYSEFPKQAFCDKVVSAFPELELKARIAHITDCLYQYLPADYPLTNLKTAMRYHVNENKAVLFNRETFENNFKRSTLYAGYCFFPSTKRKRNVHNRCFAIC